MSRRAFTLIEVLLAIGIMSILVAALAVTVGSASESESLDEATVGFETTLRMMRAEAANRGRRFQLAFEPEEGRFAVMWEPQPLAQPGEFIAFTERAWINWAPTDSVIVESAQLTGPSAMRTLVFDSGDSLNFGTKSETHQHIEFAPDGGGDSAVVVLAARRDDDGRRAVVELDGVNGLIRAAVLTPTEWAEYQAQAEDAMGMNGAR